MTDFSMLGRGILCVCVVVAVFLVHGEVSAQPTTMNTQSLSPQTQARRNLVVSGNSSEFISPLTARTERVDPLDNLKKYRGGFNITNKHYWSSTIFTGKYGFGAAAIWLFIGLVYAVILLISLTCCNKARIKSRRTLFLQRENLFPILLGIILTLAIVASGVALSGSSRVHSRARSIKNIIVAATQEATGTLHNVTEDVTALQQYAEFSHNSEVSNNLNSTSHRLSDQATKIQNKAEKTMSLVNKGLNILEAVTIATTVLNLTVVLVLMVLAPLKLHRTFSLLIVISWLITSLFWVYFGLYFVLDKFAGDTCAALDEYRQNPQNSTLSSILPCNDQRQASSLLRYTGSEIYNIIEQANTNISRQSVTIPGLANICNPISGPPEYKYQPQNCSSNTIQIGDIPKILKKFVCSEGDGGNCEQGGIPANVYSKILFYTSSLQNILDSFSGMERLVNCQLVKDAFSEILSRHCAPLKKYALMTWAAILVLSTMMVFLTVTWTLKIHQDSKCSSSDGSVKPQLTSTDNSDVESAVDTASKTMKFKLEL